MKQLFTLSIFAFIALAFWGLQSYENKNDISTADEADSHFVDLFMRDFTLTAMDKNGKPGYTLQASYFEHYKDETHSLIVEPVIHFLSSNSRWVISARTGKIDNDHKRIVLDNDVVLRQQETDFPIEVKTSQLEIDTDQQIATSTKPVNIIHNKLKLQSTGMVLNNSSGELELLARVRGNYVPAD